MKKDTTKKNIYVKNFVLIFIIYLVFATGLVAGLTFYIRKEVFSSSSASELIKKGIETNRGTGFIQMLITTGSRHENTMDSFFAICDKNGNILMEPKDTIILNVMKKDTTNGIISYELADSAKHSLDEIFEEYRINSFKSNDFYLNLKQFCLVDNTFIPLEIELVDENNKVKNIFLDNTISENDTILTSDMFAKSYLEFVYQDQNLKDFSYISEIIKNNESVPNIREDFCHFTFISNICLNNNNYNFVEAYVFNLEFVVRQLCIIIVPLTLILVVVISCCKASIEYNQSELLCLKEGRASGN